MNPPGKPLVWLRGEIKTPPFTAEARVEAGHLLRLMRLWWKAGAPHSGWNATTRSTIPTPRGKHGRSDSSQSRVDKMEAGDRSVSIELLIRSLLAMGTTQRELAQVIAHKTR